MRKHFIGNIAAKLEDNALGNITFSFIYTKFYIVVR